MKLLWIALPILTTLNQILIKKISRLMGDMPFGVEWVAKAITSPLILGVLFCEILSFVIWMQILAKYDISKAFPISGITYILILCTGWFLFYEPIMILQLIGFALIIIGVCLIGSAPSGDVKE